MDIAAPATRRAGAAYAVLNAIVAALMEQNEGAGPLFTMARDPPITPVGQFIRKFSLDELLNHSPARRSGGRPRRVWTVRRTART